MEGQSAQGESPYLYMKKSLGFSKRVGLRELIYIIGGVGAVKDLSPILIRCIEVAIELLSKIIQDL